MCYENVVRLHLPINETLVIYVVKPSTNLRIILSIKAEKCLHKKNHAFLAHIVDKEKVERNIKDIPEVCHFPDVFPEDLPRVPVERQIEFWIDLKTGAIPITKSLVSWYTRTFHPVDWTFEQGVHRSKLLPLGSFDLIRK